IYGLCNCILDFLKQRQTVTFTPQGCMLSPLLFTLMTHSCSTKYVSNHIIKFVDNKAQRSRAGHGTALPEQEGTASLPPPLLSEESPHPVHLLQENH
ncbi:hypothetical protein L3Q82_021959, partial [Scortum barcoo]